MKVNQKDSQTMSQLVKLVCGTKDYDCMAVAEAQSWAVLVFKQKT